MLELDGSYGEGGGQMLRTALALSALTGTSFKINNIRKGRENPGISSQHQACIMAVKQICSAEVTGDELGSGCMTFIPGKLKFDNLDIDIGTAGSITLLLQSLLPIMIFSKKKVKLQIHGGTDVRGGMPIDYFSHVFLPHLWKYADFEPIVDKRGYYPKGGGKLTLKIKPHYAMGESILDHMAMLRKENKPISLHEQGQLMMIKGISHASKDLMVQNVAERTAQAAQAYLGRAAIDSEYVDSLSTGSGITLWAMFTRDDELDFKNPIIIGSDSLGERGKKSEAVGEEAARRLNEAIGTKKPMDDHLVDQLLPYLALFGGSIDAPGLTPHCMANIYVIEQFLGVKFRIDGSIISV
ncbi:MAG: RNA 3'-terminal phosphate cyclase [Candidatus Woesearchaeota archaeon]|nr:RNA 3'-terminal phosphate cyclase [Candidatus Woesearchaeota archaeon]